MREFKKNIYKTYSTALIFAPFDHMVVRFKYTKPINGSDLDIMVYYDNTGTVYDSDAVGFNQLSNDIKIPTNSTNDSDAYLWWANDDNTSPDGVCVEAVVIGIKNFTDNVVTTSDTIETVLRVGWFRTLGDGKVTIELETYLGGTMSKVGTNIINTGGVLVDTKTKDVSVLSCCSQVTKVHSDLVGTIKYNKTTKTATLT